MSGFANPSERTPDDRWTAEQSLLDILEASPVGVTILDDAGQVMFWNSRLLDMLGGLQGDSFSSAASRGFFKDDLARSRVLEKFEADGLVRDAEIETLRGDGRDGWASITMQRIEFESRPAALVWFYDITERKRSDLALASSDDALIAILEGSPIGATILDAEGRVLYWNSRLLDILGVQGAGFADAAAFTFNGDSSLRDSLMAQLVEGGVVRDAPVSLPTGVSGGIAAMVSMERITFEHQPGVLIWLYDVTELRRAQENAEHATRAKSSFLATMSHEIRTPMNGVVTLAELLAETKLTTDQMAMVRTIGESGQALLTIINDILDFSKIEAGRLDLEILPLSPARMVESVSSLLGPKAHEKGLKFMVAVAPDVPAWIESDPVRLRQILLNVTGNAIKFTEHGGVSISVSAPSDRLLIEIRDTGIGLTEQQRNQLFRPFSQGDVSTARRFGGTGLGLSICRGILDVMGGEVAVESVFGKGSLFRISVPSHPCPPPEERLPSQATASGGRFTPPDRQEALEAGALILCAEDNRTNREVLARVLARLGFACDMVEDGRQALEAAERHRYGLLLSDCHMPELDGWDLAEAIRAREAATGEPRLPILALTADAVKGTAERCSAAGMDGYLTKPVALAAIEAAVCKLMPAAALLRQPEQEGVERARSAGLNRDNDAIDVSLLAELIGDDQDAIAEMLDDFLAQAVPLSTAALAQILTDPVEAHRAAHSLKSAARYVGATQLADLAAEVEAALDESRAGEASVIAAQLPAAIDDVAAAVASFRLERQLVSMRAEIGSMADDSGGGFELEAVVEITEEAASKILEAAEAIANRIDALASGDEAALIREQVTAIFEACSFQDLTSQRVRKAIARLTHIEERLDEVVTRFNIADSDSIPAAPGEESRRQDEIDRLLGGD